jgi:inhibitor of KinA
MPAPAPESPRFTPIADHALLVAFGEAISEAAHAAVLQLDQALADTPCRGFSEAIPAYVNLLVDFDPLVTDYAAVEMHVRSLLGKPSRVVHEPRLHEVAVCYEAPFARDLEAVAERTGLSVEAVINAHLSGDYQVYLYGFAPGYAYLAGTPEMIRLDRKPQPVRGIEAGAVLIAGPQCIVTTLTMPTGWWVIGRSPARILTGDPAKPFLFDVGDRIRFQRISTDDLARLGNEGVSHG